MVAAHGKIFVLGGEGNAMNGARDDPSLVHILETSRIKYPADNAPPRQPKAGQTGIGLKDAASPPQPSHTVDTPPGKRAMPTSESLDSLSSSAASPPASHERLAQIAQTSSHVPLAAPLEATILPRSESLAVASDAPPAQVQSSPQAQQAIQPPIQPPVQPPVQQQVPVASAPQANGVPPQRPRREGDEEYRRAMSPIAGGPSSPTTVIHPTRMVSPPNGPASPVTLTKNGFNPSVVSARSPSPRMRNNDLVNGSGGGDRPAPPPDAFYYGRSPTLNGHPARPGSISGSAELLKELKAKEAEADAAKKREMALRVILGRAVKQGYVLQDGEEEEEDGDEKPPSDDVVRRLTDALVKMKQEKAAIQVSRCAFVDLLVHC